MKTATIEAWTYDELHNVIWGYVFNDHKKRFQNGEWIHTSVLKSKPPFEQGVLVKTLNSTYLLGQPMKLKEAQ